MNFVIKKALFQVTINPFLYGFHIHKVNQLWIEKLQEKKENPRKQYLNLPHAEQQVESM